MSEEMTPRPVRQPFFTTGVWMLLTLVGIGFTFVLARLLTGLGPVTNLTDSYPWGIWIAIDVACGVALAAGGFTTAAIVHMFGGQRFRPLLRPALLTAWLGYTFVALAVTLDIGRYWNVWRPIFNWQGNSALFEVGMCVMAYLTVLTIEMLPPVLDGIVERVDAGEWRARIAQRLRGPAETARRGLRVVLPLFIIAGVVLSCMHQSSLGTLMVITPTKLSALWHTPWLPALFLLSAVMVGLAMVIMESILASRSFGTEPEMDILAPFAKILPWFMGLYVVAKLATLIGNWGRIDLAADPGAFTALLVELIIGLVIPLVMILLPAVRESPRWLLFAALLIVAGVVINRINVYLVGFNPPFAEHSYFPSIGEIAVTVGIVSLLVLLYRFFAINFPIISGPATSTQRIEEPELEPVPPKWAWALRGLTVLSLLAFVLLYTVVHSRSIRTAEATRRPIQQLPVTHPAVQQLDVVHHEARPQAYQMAYLMSSTQLNEIRDDYEPVRFSHSSHDNFTGGNCADCHHRISFDPDDRVGTDLAEMHAMMEIRLSGACTECHEEMEAIRPQSCTRCHNRPAEEDAPSRPGLKGAYHRQCIGCHESQPEQANAPTTCDRCHHPHVPDHSALIGELPPEPTAVQVTGRCLDCHRTAADDVMRSAHWRWAGHSPHVVGHEHDVDLGMNKVLNNYLICAGSGGEMCASCHISTGERKTAEDIDCFVCHDTTGSYHKPEGLGGAPAEDIDLAEVAESAGRPSRAACGSCHFFSDGGANVKHGDLEPVLEDPPAEIDVHMGRYDLRCQDCHRTTDHRIAGRSMTAPASEGNVACRDCHGATPHGITGLLGPHLDNHVRSVACETCHIPLAAKETATRVFIDYSLAGQDRPIEMGKLGRPTYDPDLGEMRWVKHFTPTYTWYDGTRDAYVLGERVYAGGEIVLNTPQGEYRDPASRIAPFKVHIAKQPYDSNNRILLVPQLCDFWEHHDWERAIQQGMDAVGLEYSGEHEFVTTKMYTGLHHQVMPREASLGCADCHESAAVRCQRCHTAASGIDLPEHRNRVYTVTDRMDFRELGYDGDPARVGGRFATDMGRGRPVR